MAWGKFERLRRRKARGHRYQYSQWDGTQAGFDLSADDIFDQLSDDLMYHGDVNPPNKNGDLIFTVSPDSELHSNRL